MRIFAISDLHTDYSENRRWVKGLSLSDYTHDILIVAGDVSHVLSLLVETFAELKSRFREVLFVPGNHDLWVMRDDTVDDSFRKMVAIERLAKEHGVLTKPLILDTVSLIPLLGWYDYSFAELSGVLSSQWMDFSMCRWPDGVDDSKITRFLISRNEKYLSIEGKTVVSFSHFLPRIDVMPDYIPEPRRIVYPVLGTPLLEEQIRSLGSHIHVYGHSHVNRQVRLNGTVYINNAFGYPREKNITAKELTCILELD